MSEKAPAHGRVLGFRGLAAATTDLVRRATLGRLLGFTHGGKRDLFEALGYPDVITLEDYHARFDRGDIATRIVEAYPVATWRGGGQVVEDPDPNVVTRFEEIWNQLEDRLHIWAMFMRADILAGLGQYSVILIGAPGNVNEELPKRLTQDKIAYLMPFAQRDATVSSYESDPMSPRFGLPTAYKLKKARTPLGKNQAQNNIEREVHWSRVLHVADGLLDDPIFGKPRLESVWNKLIDLDKVIGGGAEAFWMRANQGLHLDLDKEIELEPEDKKALKEEVEEYEHGLRRIFRTQGITATPLGSDVANFGPPAEAIINVIAATTGIPQRILMGSERGELASTQDRGNWDTRIADRRSLFADPFVVRPFVTRLQECGVLPVVDSYDVYWPELRNLTETEKINAAKTAAQVNKEAGRTVITVGEIRDRWLELGPIEDVDDFDEELDLPQRPQLPENTPVEGEVVEEEPEPVAAAGQKKNTLSSAHSPTALAAHRYEARFYRLMLSAINVGRAAVKSVLLDVAVASNSLDDAERATIGVLPQMESFLRDKAESLMFKTMVSGGNAEARSLTALNIPLPRAAKQTLPSISFRFDKTNPEAIAWAERNAGIFVTNISRETEGAIRRIIVRAFREQMDVADAARLIRASVGLTEVQADAVMNLYTRMLNSPGKRIYAGRVPIRVPKEGVTKTQMDRVLRSYTDRLIRQRARTIARTETIAASNEGQRQLWDQARQKGLLTGKEKRTWIVADPCPICYALGKQKRGLAEPFQHEGKLYMAPPAHPNCRCALGLTR